MKTIKKYSLTPAHEALLPAWRDRWIANAMSTAPMTDEDREACRAAVAGMYAAAGLPAPRVVFVPSPFVLRFASGFAAARLYSAATRDATRSAVSNATYAAVSNATYAAVSNATRAATYAATYAAVSNATRDATDATRYAVADATRDATYDATLSAVADATRDAVHAAAHAVTNATHAAVTDATYAATRDATRAVANATNAAVTNATHAATHAAIHAAIHAAVTNATHAATHAATYAAVADTTRDATHAATHAATLSAVADATRSATYDAVDDTKWYRTNTDWRACADALGVGDFGLRCAQSVFNTWAGGNQWSAYDAYLSFFQDIARLDLPEYKNYAHWRTLAERSGPRVVHKDFCMISDRPEILTVDDRNRPHNDTGPFCQWRDGTALYAVHGVRVPAWVVEAPERITVAAVQSEVNAEVQRVMIERFGGAKDPSEGWDNYAAATQPTILDHDERWGTLCRAPGGLFLRVINRSPEPDGSFRRYVLPVSDNCEPLPDPSGANAALGAPQRLTALNAVASTFGMTGKEYAALLTQES